MRRESFDMPKLTMVSPISITNGVQQPQETPVTIWGHQGFYRLSQKSKYT